MLVSAGDAGSGRVAVRCEVRDTGVGIAEQDVESIFDSFSQADDSLARRHAGSGLGLSIARQLARLMGGDVTVRSAPGEGSRFLFTASFGRCVGACAARAGAEDSPQPELAGLLAGRRVLVVDDHGVNRVLLADILAECGAEASLAASGREALALFTRGRFDLVLMDLQMPEMGGVETAARLRRMEDRTGSGRTPMLVLTAFASPEDAGVTLGRGFRRPGDQAHRHFRTPGRPAASAPGPAPRPARGPGPAGTRRSPPGPCGPCGPCGPPGR